MSVHRQIVLKVANKKAGIHSVIKENESKTWFIFVLSVLPLTNQKTVPKLKYFVKQWKRQLIRVNKYRHWMNIPRNKTIFLCITNFTGKDE